MRSTSGRNTGMARRSIQVEVAALVGSLLSKAYVGTVEQFANTQPSDRETNLPRLVKSTLGTALQMVEADTGVVYQPTSHRPSYLSADM